MDTGRANFERGWILISVAYGGLLAALVWKFLRKYGVNPYIFWGCRVHFGCYLREIKRPSGGGSDRWDMGEASLVAPSGTIGVLCPR